MKHEDYLVKIEQDSEYVDAKKSLKLKFDFGKAVLLSRIERGWSLSELARRVGMSHTHIYNIESGLGNPTLDSIKRIADVLDIEVCFITSSNFGL